MTQNCLDHLIHPFDRENFLKRHWLKKRLHIKCDDSKRDRFSDLFDWDNLSDEDIIYLLLKSY